MSLEWRLPEPKEIQYAKPPSAWFAVGIVAIVYLVAVVWTVLTWETGKPVYSGAFFLRVLLIPLLVSIALGAFFYSFHEERCDGADIWNYLCRRTQARWQEWAQNRIAIIGSVTLTPEEDLAERMLGLEGSEPRNEGKILPLSNDGRQADSDSGHVVVVGTRLEDVLERLVTPFASCITRFAARHTFSIQLHTDREDAVLALQALMRKLDLAEPNRIDIRRMANVVDASLIHGWMEKGTMPDFCLVLACELHRPDYVARCSEAAVSVLFSSAAMIRRYADQLKPQAYIYQPISSATDAAARALRDMLTAQQIPLQSVKHLWLTSMPRQGKHAAVAAASDAGVNAAAHDIDLAIGKPGTANALLAQALAAEMVQHGQGTQLVATPAGADVLFNLTGTDRVSVASIAPHARRYLLISDIAFALSASAICVTVFSMVAAPANLYWFIFGFFVVAVLARAFDGWKRYQQVEDLFCGRSS